MESKETKDIDLLLLKIALRDDEHAFRVLFLAFFSSLCAFAHQYIACWETCEDIVQDVFYKIWKNRKQLDIHVSGKNFLMTSVRNGCVDYLRRKDTEMSWRQNELSSDSFLDTEELYSAGELEELLHESLSRLPEAVRSTFEQSRFEGKTYAEIAAKQHISVKTVEAHISKALKQLRIDLRDWLPIFL